MNIDEKWDAGIFSVYYLYNLKEEEFVFWCSLVGADRRSRQAMPVARQEDLCVCVLWSLSLSLQSVPRCKKVALYV